MGQGFALALMGLCWVSASSQVRVQAGRSDEDGCFPKTPARICVGPAKQEACYEPASTKDYVFGLEPTQTQIGTMNGKPVILFTAMFSGCGSGTLTDFSLLTERDGKLINILPQVRLTNQSEYKLWTLQSGESLPAIATADFVWDIKAGETHFSDHVYEIAVYAYDRSSGGYSERLRYRTAKKYPGLDAAEELRVLEGEKPEILRRLEKTNLRENAHAG
jgi:hypothetical protein